MGKGKGVTGKLLVGVTIIGIVLLGFGMLQLNFDLSFIGFDITGNVTAMVTVPEINEDNQKLLDAKAFVNFGNLIETRDRFAIGERIFELQNPTVITDFTIRIATEDPNVEVKGYIWSDPSSATSEASGATNPLRIAVSPDVFNGTEIGTMLNDVTFTFPQALVLEPRQNFTCTNPPVCEPSVPLQYIVGIRVDRNLAGSFTYAWNSTESFTIPASSSAGVVTPEQTFPETHVAVIDKSVALNAELNFDPIEFGGVLGIDIFHNAPLGEDIMEDVEEIIDMSGNGTATDEEELIACIAIFPPPPECVGDDPLAPEDCGLAEDLISGVCVCKAGFTSGQDEEGNAVCLDTVVIDSTPIPPKLQVPPRVDPMVFLGLGGLLLGIGLIGIVVRKFRK